VYSVIATPTGQDLNVGKGVGNICRDSRGRGGKAQNGQSQNKSFHEFSG
jgi:hypothetical protein